MYAHRRLVSGQCCSVQYRNPRLYRRRLQGDAHYSRPHNSILSNITKLATELGVTCEKEITGEFRQLLPADRRQEAIDSRIEGHRPDFKAHLPAKNEDGEWTEELTATWYELKCVHSGKRYRDGPAGTKTVEVRAQQLRGIAKSKHYADITNSPLQRRSLGH